MKLTVLKTPFHIVYTIGIIFLLFIQASPVQAQLGKCKGKYLGNIIGGSVPGNPTNYTTYWNQVTSENGSKWGSVESSPGSYNFATSDVSYNWAKNNGALFKYHNFVWGSQTPTYINTASTATITAAVENYIKACSTHYASMGGLKMIDVLNEPVNTAMPGNMKAALTAGYQADPANAADKNNPYGWAIWPYQLARKYFPNAVLLINEYNVEMNWNSCRAPYLAITNAIKNAPNLTDGKKNLIDGVGLQCHGIDNLTAANFKACIDEIWTTTGLPTHITEFDQEANPNEAKQTAVYTALIPVAWEHPHVAGITLWGYIQGTTWRNGNGVSGASGTDSGIMYTSGTLRPAMTWLSTYMASQTSLSCCPAPAPFASCVNGSSPVVSITAPANNATYAIGASVTLTASATDADGTISKVVFYNGTTVLSTVTTAPYTYTWTNVAEGAYTITAVATDNSMNSTTSTAVLITVGNPKKEIGTNGEFDNGTTGWTLQNNSSATGTMSVVTNGNLSGTNSLRICPSTNPGTLEWHVQVSETAPIVTGKNYQITVMAKADAARQMSVVIQESASPYTTYFAQTVNLTTTAQTFTFSYNSTVTDASAQLKFYVGANSTCLNIDKVSMLEGNFQLFSVITAVSDTTFCTGGNVVLNASTGTGYTYQWLKGGAAISGSTNASYTASASGTYTVAITANSQTVTSAGKIVTVNTLPVATITSTTTSFCTGGSVVLNANAGTGLTYKWNNAAGVIAGATSASYTAVAAGSYTVTVTNASTCSATSTATAVTVNTLPAATITAAGSTNFCAGGNVVLNANTGTGLTYKWNNAAGVISGATSASYTATTADSYTVTVSNANCSATSTATAVTVNTLPTAAITAAGGTTFCAGGNVVLDANTGSGLTYKWNNAAGLIAGATSASYTASTADSYKVTVSNANCSATSTATAVTVNALPTATITAAGATAFCAGGNVVLNTNTGTGLTYKWNNAAGVIAGATSTSYTATTADSYKVTVSNANCSATSTAIAVTVNALPTAIITPAGATTFCAGGNVVLNANTGSGLIYKWNNAAGVIAGATSASYTAAVTGSYTVTVSNANCSATSTATAVTVNALPAATITAAGVTAFCAGGNVVLNANTGSGLTYKWSNAAGIISGATNASYTATTADSYKVTVSNANCSATSTATAVTVNALPTATITAAGATTFCAGGNVVLNANTGSGLTYKWNNAAGVIAGATSASYTATTADSYKVTVSNTNCSATSAPITVTISAAPVWYLDADGDGKGDASTAQTSCTKPAGAYVSVAGDACPSDANKLTPGACGCGNLETDTDGDTTPDCIDTDDDNDGIADANDCQPLNANVTGATVWYLDADGDGKGDASTAQTSCTKPAGAYVSIAGDACPEDPNKLAPGACGCGNLETDTDADTTPDCIDTDDDNDGVADANDCAPLDAKVGAATIWYQDADGDGEGDPSSTLNACAEPTGYVALAGDACPNDANKTSPGACGCGKAEGSCVATGIVDLHANGTIKIMPNPSTDLFTLLLTESSKVYISAVDGRLIEEFDAVVSLKFGSEYAKGVYVVQITNGTTTEVLRVVKQ